MNTPPTPRARTAARALVDCLLTQGVTTAFAVAGESYLAVLDALHDSRDRLRVVTCRHEASAANMAEAVGKLTGRPGVCFVTRGPGATHASIAVHTAQQDATPMVLFVGQVARQDLGRDAFQEIDFGAMFGTIAKWVVEVHEPARMSELVTRAFAIAINGRPGPVVVSLPEDVLEEACDLPAGPYVERIATPLEVGVADRIACSLCRGHEGTGQEDHCEEDHSEEDHSKEIRRIREPTRSGASPNAGSCRWRRRSAGRTCSRTTMRATSASSASPPAAARCAR